MAQRGWITKHDRKKKGSVWVYHWYVIKPETGRKAEHTCVVGSVASFPREKDAWLEIDRRHIKPQLDQGAIRTGRLTFGDLVASYMQNGMKKLAVTTRYTVKHYLDDYLLPRWERVLLWTFSRWKSKAGWVRCRARIRRRTKSVASCPPSTHEHRSTGLCRAATRPIRCGGLSKRRSPAISRLCWSLQRPPKSSRHYRESNWRSRFWSPPRGFASVRRWA